jgi:Flp pilus assembly protein TadD
MTSPAKVLLSWYDMILPGPAALWASIIAARSDIVIGDTATYFVLFTVAMIPLLLFQMQRPRPSRRRVLLPFTLAFFLGFTFLHSLFLVAIPLVVLYLICIGFFGPVSLYPPYYLEAFKSFRAGDYPRALDFENLTIEAKPDSLLAYQLRSDIHLRSNSLIEAERDTRSAIELNPKHASGRCVLGSILFRQGRYLEAREAFDEALRLAPKFVGAHYNLGLTYYQMGQYASAIDYLNRALLSKRVDPRFSLTGYYYLGRSYEALGRDGAAAGAYLKMRRFRGALDNWKATLRGPEAPQHSLLQSDIVDIERRLTSN